MAVPTNQSTVHCSLLMVFKGEQSENIFRGIRGRPKAAPTMFCPHLLGYPRTANGRPYDVLSAFVGLSEDGQWPSLRCSVRICWVVRGRPLAVPTVRDTSVTEESCQCIGW